MSESPGSLDERAERAVAALHASTAGVRPAARLAGLGRRRRRTVRLASATAFALMAGVLAVVLVVTQLARPAPVRTVDAAAVLDTYAVGRMPEGPPVKVVELDGTVWMVVPDLVSRQSGSLVPLVPTPTPVARRLDGGPDPSGATVSGTAGAAAIWTADFTGALRRVDPVSGATTLGSAAVADGRFAASLTSADGSLWVVGTATTLLRIDPANGKVLARMSRPGTTFGPNLAAGSDALWATSDFGGSATRIGFDGRLTPLATTVAGGVAAGEGGVWLGGRDGTVVRLEEASGKVVATLRVGGDNQALATGAGGVWVADSAARTLTRVDPRRNRATGVLALDSPPTAVTVAAGSVWVTTEDAVLRVDPTRF
jgi:streptogramin lyase